MKRLVVLLGLFTLFFGYSNKAVAQYYFYNDSYYDNASMFEVGGGIGAMNC